MMDTLTETLVLTHISQGLPLPVELARKLYDSHGEVRQELREAKRHAADLQAKYVETRTALDECEREFEQVVTDVYGYVPARGDGR